MTKKVLYISYDGMTDPLGQSQVLPYISGLSKHGYEFHLISFEKMDRFKAHHRIIRSICNENGIYWHPQDYQRRGVVSTFKLIRRLKKVVNYLNRRHSFDIVHCRSHIPAFSGLRLKRKFGVKFIFDMRGFWADERVDGGLWDLTHPLYKLLYNYFKRKEMAFFREADYTISLTENGKEEILSWKEFTASPPKIEVIPCCVDLNLFDPAKINTQEKSALREKLNIRHEQYVLGYIGSIGTWYMLDEMLDYFKVFKKKQKDALFVFITKEPEDIIFSAAAKAGVPKESIRTTSSLHHEVPLHISLFNASIFFIRATYSKKASSPTKQGEIMAMGIPLVCNTGIGDTDLIVSKYASGIVLDTLNESSFDVNPIDQYPFNKDALQNGAKDYFSLEGGVKKYLSVYQSLNA